MKVKQTIIFLFVLTIFIGPLTSALSFYDFFGSPFVGNVIEEQYFGEEVFADLVEEQEIIEPILIDAIPTNIEVIEPKIQEITPFEEEPKIIITGIEEVLPVENIADYPVRPTTDFLGIVGEGIGGYKKEFLGEEINKKVELEKPQKTTIMGSINSFITKLLGLE